MQTFVKHLGYKSHKGGKSSKGIGTIKAHIKYIQSRPNEQGEKETRELFGKDGESSRQDFCKLLDEQPQKGVIAHKLCISMDRKDYEAQKIDLKELTRDTMSAWEAKLGRQLNWTACIHLKDSNPHVHIVVAGRDQGGKELYIKDNDLERLKKIADRERGLQAERNTAREADKEKGFDFEKQIAHEKSIEQEPRNGHRLDRDIEQQEKIHERGLERTR